MSHSDTMAALKADIEKGLNNVIKSAYLKSNPDTITFTSAVSDANDILNGLFVDDSTTGAFGSNAVFARAATSNTVYVKVKGVNGTTAYTNANIDSITSVADITDINVGSMLSAAMFTKLQALYLLHNTLGNGIYTNFANGNDASVTVDAPDNAGSTVTFTLSKDNDSVLKYTAATGGASASQATTDANAILNMLNNQVNTVEKLVRACADQKIDAFLMRRIIAMLIMAYNFKTAMALYWRSKGSPAILAADAVGTPGTAGYTPAKLAVAAVAADPALETYAKKVALAIYKLLYLKVYLVANDQGTGDLLAKRMNKRMLRNASNVETIKQLDTDMDDVKIKLSDTQSTYDKRISIEKTSRMFNYTCMAVAIAVCLVACVLLLLRNTSQKIKLIVGLVTIGVSIITTVTVYFSMKSVVKEPFANTLGIVPGTTTTHDIDLLYESFFGKAREFLDQSLYLQNLLKGYKAYGNMNQSMQKEITYFKGAYEQLNNAKSKIGNASALVVLQVRMNKFRSIFFSLLAVIISACITLYIAAEEHPGAQKIILGVSGFLITVLFVFFIFQRNSLVRTDPKRYYWGSASQSAISKMMT